MILFTDGGKRRPRDTPMDYDDSEFQNQSFQLVDDNKFPSSLQSFALPKIDIDEHLEVHLRFDRLVDTEVLLGIQGQDNNWIEDFSSGATAIEFSSTAAESCSISRHKNVWSEATSSESVEMLLKSVVEDEMTDRKMSIMETDVHDVLVDERDQTDIILKQDDNNLKVGDNKQNDPAQLPNQCLSNFSAVDEDANGDQMSVEGSAVERSSEFIASPGRQDVPSSVLGNLGVGLRKFHVPAISDQVVEEDTGVRMTEKSDLLFDDGRKATSLVTGRDGDVHKQCLEGQEAMSGLSTGKDSSLDPIMDSMMLMSQECNESGYSENPDGLLEVIAYPAKALNKGIEASGRSSIPANDMCSPMEEQDRPTGMQPVKIDNEHVPILSHFVEDSQDVCRRQPDPGSKADSLHVELPTHTAKMIDHHLEEHLDSHTEVTGGEQSPGELSEMPSEVHATVPVDYETQINEMKDINSLVNLSQNPRSAIVQKHYAVAEDAEKPDADVNSNSLVNFKSQIPESAVVENHFEDGVAEDAKKPEAEVNASDAQSNVSRFPASLSDDVKMSFLADDSVEKDKMVPSTPPDVTHVNNNDGFFMEKANDATSAGQDVDTSSVLTDSVANMTKNESAIGHALIVVELGSLGKDENNQSSHPDISKPMDEIVEVKGKSVDTLLSNESAVITDLVATSGLPLKEDLQNDSGTKVASLGQQSQDISAVEQKDDANPCQLASEPVVKPTINDHTSLDSTMEAQTIVDGKSSSEVDSVDASCHNQSQLSVDKSISRGCTLGIKGVLLVNDSTANEKDAADLPDVFAPVNKEIAVTVTGFAQNSLTNISASTLIKNDAEDHVVEADSGKPSSSEANYGSPMIISSSEPLQEQGGVLSGQTCTVSNIASPTSSETRGHGDKVKLTAQDLHEITVSEGYKSFTFEVPSLADISERHAGSEYKPFSNMHTSEFPKTSKDKSRRSHTASKEGKHGVRRKTPTVNKSTRVTESSNESLTTPKGKSAKGTPTLRTPIDKDGRSGSTTSTSVGPVSRDMQLEERRRCESNKMKTSCSPVVQTSGLPALNSSIKTATLFYQPFTALQQVQLRAQIFVYGSLIQGIPPDEACMVSAVGEIERGRSSWEGVWRSYVEKYQNQKSPFVNSETKHPRSAVRVIEQETRCSSLESKVSNISPSQSGGKVVPSALQNSTPLPSPVWSIPTHDVVNTNVPRGKHLNFSQALSPLHSYYSSQTRQLASNSSPWPSQAPLKGPGGVPVQGSTLNAAIQYSTVPVVETVQVTTVRDSCMPHAPSTQLVTPSALVPTSSPLSVTAVTLEKNETQRKNASPGTSKHASNQKPRRRKKAAGPEDLSSIVPVSQSTTEPASAATAIHVSPASAGLVSSSSVPIMVAPCNLKSTTVDIFPSNYQIADNSTTEQRALFSEQTSSRIEQAKLQAEDAAALAATSVRHSQGIWSQLAAHRDSGLVSEVEVKLAFAAVAAAAAASVAKAAAAAAKVASDAALQAKMMADETLGLAKTRNMEQIPESGLDSGKNLERLTPGSILKGKNKTDGSSSVISAAREAARRRVEAASAAAKQAENIDAIVKAAELAAEAVSQAGAIITMGDPLPFKLSELVDAGPEGFWKLQRSSTEKLKTDGLLGAETMGLEHKDNFDRVVKQSNEKHSNNGGIRKPATECGLSNSGQSLTFAGNNEEGRLVNAVPVPDDMHQSDHLSTNLMGSDIQQGSLVEVVSDDNGLRGAWFSARVLDLKDKKAYVCYDNLTDKGFGQLKEWVSLEGDGHTFPRIRIAHPMTISKHEGIKKRRREAVGTYVWAIGDHVDAWMNDGWREGIVTEKDQGDETKLTVHFPAGGDSSVVRAWNLRPSLIWQDGQWIEWLRARENRLQPHEGDTPLEKRQKLGKSEAKFDANPGGRGIGKLSEKNSLEDSRKPEESIPLNLSAKDQIFSAGRNVIEESTSDALKVKRTGLQKEGSRVVFGVPKPGKKRKFMDVSKHYVTDNKPGKTSKENDSLKFSKYLMPQESRLWKSTSKLEPKGKLASESNKSRGIKPVKSQTIQTRSTTEKDNSSISNTSVSNGGENGRGALRNVRSGTSEKSSSERNPIEVVSFPRSLGTDASLTVESHAKPGAPDAKIKSASAAEGVSRIRGRPASVDKPTRIEDKGEKSVDSVEPRRSNRRIQPTSRLLEGLQSSLIVSKIPSFSHDKITRPKYRGSSSSRGSSRA